MSKPLVEYQIVSGTGKITLSREVNEALRNGWQLVGGVASQVEDGTSITLFQAMTREPNLSPTVG
jgi:hypothetical protein